LAGNVACIGEKRNAYGALVGKPEGIKTCLEDMSVEFGVILKRI
jgi:hypothetical protein